MSSDQDDHDVRTHQEARASRDAYQAGRDVIVNNNEGSGAFPARRVPPNNTPSKPDHFAPREELLAKTKTKLLKSDGNESALVVGLVAMGGAGKSVLARALARDEDVQRAFPDGIRWLELGATPSLLRRQADLAEAFGDPRGAADLQQGLTRINDLLHGAACLVVLDNVWEREHLRAFELLEPNSALLVTTRNEHIFDRSAEIVRIEPLQGPPARQLLADWAAAHDLATLPEEAEKVAQECGGLPLALAIAGAMVADGFTWDYVLERLRQADLHRMPIHLRGYEYEDLFRVLDASVDALAEDECDRYLELAVFDGRGNVPVKVVERLWQEARFDDLETKDLIIRLARRSLLQYDKVAGTVTLHDLQFDYAHHRLDDGLQAIHSRLAEAILDDWGGVADGLPGLWDSPLHDLVERYGVSHLTAHLKEARQEEAIHHLLALDSPVAVVAGRPARKENAWYSVHDRIGQIAAYSDDIGLAWSLAKIPAGVSAEDTVTAEIGLEVRYALVTASITSIAASIPPRLLVALVECGNWPAGQAFAYAGKIPVAEVRARALVHLLSVLRASGDPVSESAEIAAEARATAETIGDPGARASILTALAHELPDPDREVVLSQAWEAIGVIPGDYSRAKALAGLAIRNKLPVPMRLKVIAAAHQTDASSRASILTALIPQLRGASRVAVVNDVREAIGTITHPETKAAALTALVPKLARAYQAELVNQAREAVHAIPRAESQAKALVALVAQLPKSGDRLSLVEEAQNAIEAISQPEAKAAALTALIPKVVRAAATKTAARNAIRAISQPEAQAAALTTLIPAIRNQRDRSALMREALAAIGAISEPQVRIAAHTALALQVPEADRAAMLARALADARAIDDVVPRAKTFAVLASNLARLGGLSGEQDIQYLLKTALADARATADPSSRAVMLAFLVCLASEADRGAVISDVLMQTEEIVNLRDQVLAFAALASAVPKPGHIKMIQRACAAACAIPDRDERDAALATLVSTVPEALGVLARGADWAIGKALDQSATLAGVLVACVPEAEDRLAILDTVMTALTLHRLPPAVMRDSIPSIAGLPDNSRLAVAEGARAVNDAIDRAYVRATALAAVIPGNEELLTGVARDRSAARIIAKTCSKARLLQDLASEFPEAFQDKMLAAADAIQFAHSWAECNPATQQLEPAYRIARASSPRKQPHPQAVIADLALPFSEPHRSAALSQAWQEALAIRPPSGRATALAALIPYLADAERTAVMGQTLAAARSIDRADIRTGIIETVAMHCLTGPVLPWDPHWRAVIEDSARRGRAILISDLSVVGEIVFRLGGSLAVRQSIQALLDVGRWWP